MIAHTDVEPGRTGTDLPRAYDPSLADRLNLPETRPGWDVGPERRIDDGRSVARMLAFAGIGLALLGVGSALLHRRRA